MEKFVLCTAYSLQKELEIKKLGGFAVIRSQCRSCGTEVMMSAETKKILDADSDVIAICGKCAAQLKPDDVVHAMSGGQFNELRSLIAKKMAQNN